MKTTIRKTATAAAVALAAFALGLAPTSGHAASILEENFDSYTAGTSSSGGALTPDISVVQFGGSDPSNQFRITNTESFSGNNSLTMVRPVGAFSLAAVYNVSSSSIDDFRGVSFWFKQTTTGSGLDLQWRSGGTVMFDGGSFRVQHDVNGRPDVGLDSTGTDIITEAGLTLGDWYRLEGLFDFDADEATFRVFDTSNTLVPSGSVSAFNPAVIPFNADYSDLDDLRIFARSFATEFIFIDDLNVVTIPEPGTIALFGIGALCLASLRKRRVS